MKTKTDNRPETGRVYRHFKGGLYIPREFAEHTETGDELVIYASITEPNRLWARPLSMWNETVTVNGVEVTRFSRFEDPDEMLEAVWDAMEDEPFDEEPGGDQYICHDFYVFRQGTCLDDIWHYFDTHHSKGVHWLLYERKRVWQ